MTFRRASAIAALAIITACSPELASDPFSVAPSKVDLAEIVKAFDANEAKAQADYGGKLIMFDATVEKINLNGDDEPFVNLRGGEGLLPIQLSFAPGHEAEAQSLAKGQSVSFQCLELSEMMGTPMLGQCRIAPA